MLHLQALEERKAWERECARVAAFQAGTVEGDDSTVEAEGLEGDVAVDAGVDAEALDDVLSTEEREMQELVAAHEEGDPFFASNAEAAFDEPCGEWMRYRRCVHGAGHCGYLESIAQQDARHEALDEVPLPRMDQSMDESGGGEVRGDGEEAASHWGSDDMDSSFEDELWRLGDSIGADDDGDKMDMS